MTLLQLLEYVVALGLVTSALHSPSGAGLLLVTALVVAGWALIHDAPASLRKLVGSRAHRVGVFLEAIGLVALPVALGRVGDLTTSGPMILAAIVLAEVGRLTIRVSRPRGADPASRESPAPAGDVSHGLRELGRIVGARSEALGNEVANRLPTAAGRMGEWAGRAAAGRVRRRLRRRHERG
jgi:hypothetical protein